MTPAQPSAETVEVIQSDRDFAAVWIVIVPENARLIRSGKWDHHHGVQAAARHRLAHSTPPASDVIERAVAAETERCARIAYAVANRPVQAPEQGVWERAERATGRTLATAIRRPQQPASDEGRAS